MEVAIFLLVVVAILCIVSGPIALILSITALNKINRQNQYGWQSSELSPLARPVPSWMETIERPPQPVSEPEETIHLEVPVSMPATAQTFIEPPQPQAEPVSPLQFVPQPEPEARQELIPPSEAAVSRPPLEQIIGTRWVMIAGAITVFFAIGLFLKYAYDNALIGPWGRVAIAAASGIAALILGEVTRRRGYQIVAKGVTALGFAILYATVFSAYGVYELIPATPSFALAILITIGAMAYATVQNEVIMAILALLGGYMTPILLSTGQNLPIPLFIYVLILGLGAMGCAVYRKWPGVNLLCFFGTYGLYTGWFENFYRPAMYPVEGLPPQMGTALLWLAIFFVVFLALPLVYSLVHNNPARKQDVTLVLSNSAAIVYYLWTILYPVHRNEMALCCAILFVIHTATALLVLRRCPQDDPCRMSLVAIGLFFVTLAIPLYFRMQLVSLIWAAETAVLVFIGLRYRSIITQVAAAAAMALSLIKLCQYLPLHDTSFRLILNPQFGTWCFVAAMVFISHLLYRRDSSVPFKIRSTIYQLLYGLCIAILTVVLIMEWYCHCDLNLGQKTFAHFIFHRGMFILASIVPLLFLIRPIAPAGRLISKVSVGLTGASTAYVLIAFVFVHQAAYRIFFNGWFGFGMIFIASLFLWVFLLRRAMDSSEWNLTGKIATLFVRLVPAVLVSEEIFLFWYCRDQFGTPTPDWYFYALISILILWTVYGSLLLPRLSMIVGIIGGVFLAVLFPDAHSTAFPILFNSWFLVGLGFVAALIAAAVSIHRNIAGQNARRGTASILAFTAVVVLWVLITEEIFVYWDCFEFPIGVTGNRTYYSNMYISIFWAVYGAGMLIAGFVLQVRSLRYMSLGLFGLLLAKIFLIDMQQVRSVYRMAAFLATGLTLVGVSYLYQYAKKKGIFDMPKKTMPSPELK
jgi:uncharacterized membrane protein